MMVGFVYCKVELLTGKSANLTGCVTINTSKNLLHCCRHTHGFHIFLRYPGNVLLDRGRCFQDVIFECDHQINLVSLTYMREYVDNLD